MERSAPVLLALLFTGTCLFLADLSSGTEDECTCRDGDYVEFPCEINGEGEVSRSAVCGSCKATCGRDGACQGPGIADCLMCGAREFAGEMVEETYLWREGPEDPRACNKGHSNDPGCNAAASAGECRPCTSCSNDEFTKSICTSHKDTVCQEKTKLPPPRFLPYNMNEGDQSTQIGIVVSLEDMKDKGSLDQVFLQFVIVADPDWSTIPSAPSCDRQESRSQGTLSAFFNSTKPMQVVAVTCPAAMDGPWLPSGPVYREIKMKVPCTCKTGDYVERKCDVETGTAVQCGSCDVFCGKGGACVGQAPDQCLSCGIPLVGEDSARTNSMPDLMSFLPSEASSSSSEPLGTCHLCPLSCDQGSFMAEPCTADAQATCKRCSSCPGNSRVLLPCDPASNYDTICVSEAEISPAEPSLSPVVPILLTEEGDGKVDVRLSSAPGTFLLYSVSEQAQKWMQAACYLESLRTVHGIKSSKDRGGSDAVLNSVSLTVTEGRVTIAAVACPDSDSDNMLRKDPPSSVMVQEIVALHPYTESPEDASQAAVNGAVEIALRPADSSALSTDGLVKRFHSLFDSALQSYDVGTPVLALRWYVNGGPEKGDQASYPDTDENGRPRKLLFKTMSTPSNANIAEEHSSKGSVEISFSVFTEVVHVRKVMELINQQLQPQGGIGLALSIDQLEMQQISIPVAICPDEETRPCEYSEGPFSSCQLSGNSNLLIGNDGREIKCTKKMEQMITSTAGLCAEPCNPLLQATVPCPECECDKAGCISPLQYGSSVDTKAASRLQQKQHDSAVAHQTSTVAVQEESGSHAWMSAVAFICCTIGIVLIWVAVSIHTNKRRQRNSSSPDASDCSESGTPGGYPENQSVFHNPTFSTSDWPSSADSMPATPREGQQNPSSGRASATSNRSIGGSFSSAINMLPFIKKSPSSDEQMLRFLTAISDVRSNNALNDGA